MHCTHPSWPSEMLKTVINQSIIIITRTSLMTKLCDTMIPSLTWSQRHGMSWQDMKGPYYSPLWTTRWVRQTSLTLVHCTVCLHHWSLHRLILFLFLSWFFHFFFISNFSRAFMLCICVVYALYIFFVYVCAYSTGTFSSDYSFVVYRPATRGVEFSRLPWPGYSWLLWTHSTAFACL